MLRNIGVIVFALFSIDIYSEEQIVQVLDDSGKGVKSKIFVLLGNDNEPKGITDDSGNLALSNLCQPGELVEAEPINSLYYKGTSDCSSRSKNTIVKVTSKSFADNLINNAINLEEKGQYGTAALGYTEFAYRMDKIDSEKASSARVSAYLSFAKSLNVTDEDAVIQFDPQQNATVLTKFFVDKVKLYQSENGLPQTGKLDFVTLENQAEKSLFSILMKRIEE
ncbi:peptidoglycan-binding protein [Pleionea sediminis]|uniref:peptidoglycan-binding protein n=1 Tax=Pleionea sediminis TaxID=2569479 RepID=UPI00118558D9|nr:peptidoglycan-binding protein [Pleionea sediminis]